VVMYWVCSTGFEVDRLGRLDVGDVEKMIYVEKVRGRVGGTRKTLPSPFLKKKKKKKKG
jgi:hypothetical protein